MIIGERILEELGTGQARRAAEWLPSHRRVLEIGCSSGYLTHLFSNKSHAIVGVDMNRAALTKAHQRCARIPVACADAEHLPFADDSFDAIVMLEVIEHTNSDVAAITELRRVLKPGGVLILSTPHAGLFSWLDPYNVRQVFRQAFPALYRAGARMVRFESGQYTDNMEWHRHYRLSELRALLEDDFVIDKTYRGGLLLYPIVAALISVAGRLLKSPALLYGLFRMLNWDFRHPYGPLSYNLMVRGFKKS
jgi:SAM-dependent methyltransferase